MDAAEKRQTYWQNAMPQTAADRHEMYDAPAGPSVHHQYAEKRLLNVYVYDPADDGPEVEIIKRIQESGENVKDERIEAVKDFLEHFFEEYFLQRLQFEPVS